MEYNQSKISQHSWDKLLKDASSKISADQRYLTLNSTSKSPKKRASTKPRTSKKSNKNSKNISKNVAIPKNNIY